MRQIAPFYKSQRICFKFAGIIVDDEWIDFQKYDFVKTAKFGHQGALKMTNQFLAHFLRLSRKKSPTSSILH